ncbi:MAG: FAD-dependent oxidoreductase [Methanobacteriota archaeon]
MNDIRIGVFVCHCGTNIGGFLDIPGVITYAKRLPGVVYAEQNLYTCADDGLRAIKAAIISHQLNRVVVAACTPRTHAPLFRSACKDAGLNPYLFEFVNIRDQCSWVHMNEREKATEKAKDLIRMGIAKSALLEPDEDISVDVEPSSLVIGGGIAGMTAALSLAKQGFQVYIVEKESELGGMLKNLHSLYPSNIRSSRALQPIVDEVRSSEQITILASSRVQDLKGFIGNFDVTVNRNGEEISIRVGTIIVATGATTLKPEGLYRYHHSDQVITQFELEGLLNEGFSPPDEIVMIQCAGSRGQTVSYCSRICCMVAIKNAILLKEMNPNARITILHNDIQVYGAGYETQYRNAREKGVRFVPFLPGCPPVVGDTVCTVYDSMLHRDLVIQSDLVILSTPLVQTTDAQQLSKILKVPLGQDNFFFEAHVKLRPVDFANDGIYVCGTARGPAGIPESVEQALATASRAGIPMWNRVFETDAINSVIDPSLCIGCGVCENLCPYQAIHIENKKAYSIKALCKGCGNCGAACPTHAISMSHFTDEQIRAQIHAAFIERRQDEIKIIVFCCNWCSYAGADFAGVARFQYPPNTRIIRVMCSARVDPVFIFDAFTEGADGVLISGCHLQDCHYIDGNLDTLRRYNLLHTIYERYGLGGRIRLEWVSASEGEKFSEITKSFVDRIKSLGTMNEVDRKILKHLRAVFQGKKLRLMLGLAKKSIQKGISEEDYGERLLQTILREMDTAQKEDGNALIMKANTRTIYGVLSSSILARGDNLVITGAVTGPPPPEIVLWIFGDNFNFSETISIESDDTFQFTVPPFVMEQLNVGEYSVILQHPGENNKFDLILMITEGGVVVKNIRNDTQFLIERYPIWSSEGPALTDMILADGSHNILFHIPLSIQEPFIRVDPISDKLMGESFPISGCTNLSEGEELSVFVSPIRTERKKFYPEDDTILKAYVRSGQGGENPWSSDAPCSLKKPQEYTVLVRSRNGIVAAGTISVKWRLE